MQPDREEQLPTVHTQMRISRTQFLALAALGGVGFVTGGTLFASTASAKPPYANTQYGAAQLEPHPDNGGYIWPTSEEFNNQVSNFYGVIASAVGEIVQTSREYSGAEPTNVDVGGKTVEINEFRRAVEKKAESNSGNTAIVPASVLSLEARAALEGREIHRRYIPFVQGGSGQAVNNPNNWTIRPAELDEIQRLVNEAMLEGVAFMTYSANSRLIRISHGCGLPAEPDNSRKVGLASTKLATELGVDEVMFAISPVQPFVTAVTSIDFEPFSTETQLTRGLVGDAADGLYFGQIDTNKLPDLANLANSGKIGQSPTTPVNQQAFDSRVGTNYAIYRTITLDLTGQAPSGQKAQILFGRYNPETTKKYLDLLRNGNTQAALYRIVYIETKESVEGPSGSAGMLGAPVVVTAFTTNPNLRRWDLGTMGCVVGTERGFPPQGFVAMLYHTGPRLLP